MNDHDEYLTEEPMTPHDTPVPGTAEAATPEPRTKAGRRLYQCPGCWSWGMYTADGTLECDCGERLTLIDLRDASSGTEAAARDRMLRDSLFAIEWIDGSGAPSPTPGWCPVCRAMEPRHSGACSLRATLDALLAVDTDVPVQEPSLAACDPSTLLRLLDDFDQREEEVARLREALLLAADWLEWAIADPRPLRQHPFQRAHAVLTRGRELALAAAEAAQPFTDDDRVTARRIAAEYARLGATPSDAGEEGTPG